MVNDVSFQQQATKKVAIAGETGSGKSTLLKMIAGLVQPDAGNIYFEGNRVIGPEEQLLPGHPAIAYLSQHFELRNNYRVEEILDYANKWTDEEAAAIYEICRIEHLLKRRTDELSGGEKQRIATAKLLISSPKLLLLDEPYSNLDIIHRNILKQVINDIGERLNITCIIVSHDPADILSWADEIIVMKHGRIIQQADPYHLYKFPVDTYTAGLFGKYNALTRGQFESLLHNGDHFIIKYRPVVRPEEINLFTHNNHGTAATVERVDFIGDGYEVEVKVEDFSLTIKTRLQAIERGQTVFITLQKPAIQPALH